MNISLEAVENVMKQSGAEFKDAKEALIKANGDEAAAINLIKESAEAKKDTTAANGSENTEETKAAGNTTDEIKSAVDKLKKKVEEGNVDRIQIKKGDEVVFSVPVNVGILGGIIGLAAAPWALIAGAVAAFGLGCRLEVVKKDGTTDEIE
ncbi:MAG: DUF4342 domain-containing protein [Butyrivibrio sp.]|nr:DUF4342 domain-containing protein [Butyrivibrio sp.]